MAFLVIRNSERDLAFSLKLAADLAIELGLVGLDGQGDVGALLETPAKNACVVCRASAWISLPSQGLLEVTQRIGVRRVLATPKASKVL